MHHSSLPPEGQSLYFRFVCLLLSRRVLSDVKLVLLTQSNSSTYLELRILRVLQDGIDHIFDLLLIVLVALDTILTQTSAGRVDDVGDAVQFSPVGKVRVRAGLGRLGVGAVLLLLLLLAAGPAVERTAVDHHRFPVVYRFVLEAVALRTAVLPQIAVSPALALAVRLAVLYVLDFLDRVAHLLQLPTVLLERLLHDLILDQQIHRDFRGQSLVAHRSPELFPRRLRFVEVRLADVQVRRRRQNVAVSRSVQTRSIRSIVVERRRRQSRQLHVVVFLVLVRDIGRFLLLHGNF